MRNRELIAQDYSGNVLSAALESEELARGKPETENDAEYGDPEVKSMVSASRGPPRASVSNPKALTGPAKVAVNAPGVFPPKARLSRNGPLKPQLGQMSSVISMLASERNEEYVTPGATW